MNNKKTKYPNVKWKGEMGKLGFLNVKLSMGKN